ncbi:MAG: DUF1643 domain-containing protein, partial [Puniceicoccales bacterium]
PLVLAQPDNTQYQIMRVMAARGWSHVRVLNLSDLRDPKSQKFISRTRMLESLPDGDAHSLFSAIRTHERNTMLNRKPNAPFILGWGQHVGLVRLADQCLHNLKGQRIVTVRSKNDHSLTAHPSPMRQSQKLKWLERILRELS